MAIDTRTVNIDWVQISSELRNGFGGSEAARAYGVDWFYAAVHRTRDGNNRKLIELGNPGVRIIGQRERTMIIFAQTGLSVNDVLDIRQDGMPSTCRLAKSRLNDVIIVEWEVNHPAHADPELYIDQLISRLRDITEGNP